MDGGCLAGPVLCSAAVLLCVCVDSHVELRKSESLLFVYRAGVYNDTGRGFIQLVQEARTLIRFIYNKDI